MQGTTGDLEPTDRNVVPLRRGNGPDEKERKRLASTIFAEPDEISTVMCVRALCSHCSHAWVLSGWRSVAKSEPWQIAQRPSWTALSRWVVGLIGRGGLRRDNRYGALSPLSRVLIRVIRFGWSSWSTSVGIVSAADATETPRCSAERRGMPQARLIRAYTELPTE